ncbi:MAG: DUF4923 family protein [Muribaculaceae bacterium]|nr:DUF4923 family protein [Muribaculaceae bacterium]
MVKKAFYSLVLTAMLVLSSCGGGGGLLGNLLGLGTTTTTNNTGSILGSVLGSVLGGGSNGILGNIFGFTDNAANATDMVIGGTTINKNDLVGTWIYAQPGCAFTSQNALINAGGVATANKVKQTLTNTFNSLGFANNNTGFAFKQDGTFEAVLKGVGFNGTYTYDSSGKLNLKTSGGTIPMFVSRIGNGMSFTMESKTLLSVLQALGATSGNSTINSVASQVNGVRLGFDMAKYK